MTFADCYRCRDTGFLWLNSEGAVVGPDALDAEVSFKCTHDGRMRRIKRAFEIWKQDQLTEPINQERKKVSA